MQLTRQILSSNQLWDALYGILGKRSATKNHLPSENSGFTTIFAENSPLKQFPPSNFSATVKHDVANAPQQSANEFCKCVCGK